MSPEPFNKNPRYYSTEEAASVVRFKGQTLRRSLCQKGHFKGVQPRKLPGGRLLWPADEIDALATGSSEAVTPKPQRQAPATIATTPAPKAGQ